MALSHLVDTSVLTRLKNQVVRTKLEPLLAGGRAARTGISDLEVGYAARNADEWDELMGALNSFELVETDSSHVRRARQVQRLLAARSQRGRKIPDLLIAAAAEAEDLIVLHYDSDFDLIAGVTGQQCEWVIPQGTMN